jgi:hypothetical protein
MLISTSDHKDLLLTVGFRDQGIRFVLHSASIASILNINAHIEYEEILELSVSRDGLIGRRMLMFKSDSSKVLLAETVVREI